jgi:hypothetical protein
MSSIWQVSSSFIGPGTANSAKEFVREIGIMKVGAEEK